MSQKLDTSPAAIGIDIGKNSFHIVGQNQRGAIPMSSVDGVPAWFVRLLIAPNISDRFPIYVVGQRVGDLVFKANMSADLSERC